MQHFDENRVTSPTKRLGVSLNVDTGYNKGKGKGKEVSPPQTPESKPRLAKANITAANRALRVKTGPRETFLDDITPVDRQSNKENETEPERSRINRDSHDLSLSPRNITRDSLVDHMLLSLDQFSFDNVNFNTSFGQRNPTVEEEQLYSSFNDREEPYPPAQTFTPRQPRGSGHNYSYSSDYDNADDSSRYSEHLARGRRSNSSSNFPSGLNKTKSVRKDTAGNQKFAERGPPIPIPARKTHSRGGKSSSKGSSTASMDMGYAQVTGTQRWTHGLSGRASSFDYGNDQHSITAQADAMAALNASVTSFSPYDYEAAPTPTVPGGPRRTRPPSPIMLPESSSLDSMQKLERKRSARSTKSAYKGKPTTAISHMYDYGLQDKNRELPALPAFNKEEPAPAPHVGYGKTKEALPAPIQLQPKERPGFFRRVFGSSKNIHAGESLPSHGSNTSAETMERPSSKMQQAGSQNKNPNAPPPPPKEHTHVLSKKPSSFFRRRKKSVSEPEVPVPVPIVPTLLPAERENLPQPQASPVSSLRKVMSPYLQSPGRVKQSHTQSTLGSHVSDYTEYDERDIRGFSPEYTPDKNATIRTVRTPSREGLEKSPSTESGLLNPNSSTQAAAAYGNAQDGSDVTFLQDNSENGDAHSSATDEKPIPAKDANDTKWIPSPAPPVSPSMAPTTTVARDMALVAEYERIHSKRSPSTPARASSPALSSSKSVSAMPENGTTKPKAGADEEWVMLTPTKVSKAPQTNDHRVWLEPTSSEEDLTGSKLSLPKDKQVASVSGSIDPSSKSATSLPIVQIEGESEEDLTSSRKLLTAAEAIRALDELIPAPIDTTPTEGEREKAKKIYDGNEDFIQKEKAAAWMGEEGPVRMRTLLAYMELYEFANLNILAALRNLCGRLVLKAESQQVDRILDAFAKRWCQCNPDHGFKVTDVVHTICYSILLLNTDLHMADIEQKMTRSQFVKNTMPTIRRAVADSAPDAFEPQRPSVLPGKSQTFVDPTSTKQGETPAKAERPSLDVERPSWRNSFRPMPRSDSDLGGNAPTPLDYDTPMDDCGPLVKAPFHGTLRTWEVQVEIVLKDFYISIRNERLPLFGATIEKSLPTQSSNTLSVFASGMLRRTPSVLSKAPSETQSYLRGRTADTVRAPNGKWTNKNRSRARVYPNSGMGSSRTSLDDQSSMWSPSVASSTWSKYSLGKTHTSMSVDSFGSSWHNNDYQQSIGFANALSQAIIREESHTSHTSNSGSEDIRAMPMLEDESLELTGAPWAKEGIVKHKHHLEALDKKAKDRNWTETFAVIEKGYMSLFSFSTKSLRHKAKSKAPGQTVVGGGNWQENAESLGSFLLRQTIASALPSPGYSKARPHVWALSLPTGAVHLFQVGTPDIVKEFVSTANYWSARLSNHPLVGGISNIEFGWSEAIVNNALVTAINEAGRPSTGGARPSMQSSLRGSLDQGPGGAIRGRLPGDRINISEWTPPTQSMRSSNLMEADQLKTLTDYVSGVEEELQKHNLLRNPMQLAFTPRHPNAQKAMANWERKSSYLLREIVKFRTYIDTLHFAQTSRENTYAERAKEKEMMERREEEEEEEAESEIEDGPVNG
ncbi:hypothetical protein BP5796_06097 [Coleophoma crateriformis]|uniref:SEC7 domain-containing protein n=1 Tax=Coleophoma crateriformis TaxID=565419 RepID=A0A3D8RW59_9HELO|nr:hypothetical protein BP5796_06097 [Coleophoma crateriformis]